MVSLYIIQFGNFTEKVFSKIQHFGATTLQQKYWTSVQQEDKSIFIPYLFFAIQIMDIYSKMSMSKLSQQYTIWAQRLTNLHKPILIISLKAQLGLSLHGRPAS